MPRYHRRLFFLKALVLLSMAGALASTFTLRQGWGEIYPFFNWKLYTQPRGNTHVYSVYRVYTRQAGETQFKRQQVQATPTFNRDDYTYMLWELASRVAADSSGTTNNREKLEAFVKHVHPKAQEYRVVQETMQVKDLLNHPEKYDTITVARFK
ncbi:hypothetical protein [Rufibacter roseus]|uniref:Uncharacterized protein n=1 Tax=Rufibacter roseus TaxID=1567108 RepID=A0ABW2DF06_9BACT|nr:hypothetical protein [Rufibacter roseus]